MALALDVWLRFWVLIRYRRRQAEKIACFNRVAWAWGRALFSTVRWAVRLRIAVEGEVPSKGRFLIVANHQSSFDIPLLITLFRPLNLKFVAMEELRRGKPTISLVLRHGGFAIVGQQNIGQDLAALARCAANLEQFDGSPVIFPAGWVERDQEARRFYLAGLEVLRRGSRLPILPVAIAGMERAPSFRSIARAAGSCVTVRISDPIPCEVAGKDPRATYLRLEEKIYGDVAEIRAGARGPSGGAPGGPADPVPGGAPSGVTHGTSGTSAGTRAG